MKIILLALTVTFLSRVQAQNSALFNNSYSFSYQTSANDVTTSWDDGWIFCGFDQTSHRAFISSVNAAGEQINFSYLTVPGNEFTEAISILRATANTFIVAGLCRLYDDVGPNRGFVTLIDSEGNQMWTTILDPIIYDVKVSSDSVVYCAGMNVIFSMNQLGDTLGHINTTAFLFQDILDNNNFILTDDSTVVIVDQAATEISSAAFTNILDVCNIGNDRLAVFADNKLQIFDYSFNPITSTPALGNFNQGSVFSDEDGFWLETQDSDGNGKLIYLDNQLNQVYDKSLPVSLDDYSRKFFAVFKEDTIVSVLGSESYGGFLASAHKTFNAYSGETAEVISDPRLISVSRSFLAYEIDTFSSSYFLTTFHFNYEVTIENDGVDTIHDIVIAGNIPGGINWSLENFYIPLQGISIAPGNTFQYSFPVNFSLSGFYAPMTYYSFNSCVWLSSPNKKIDADLTNNYNCDMVTGMTEIDPGFNVKLFPNPASEYAFLTGESDVLYGVEIFDINGQRIYGNSFRGKITLNTFDFPRGIYFVRLQNHDAILVKKLMLY